jgi:nicotinamide riboside transporter PnuC
MTRRYELLGILATVIAVLGVLLNNGRVIWCFPVWGISNTITLYLHLNKRMFSLAARDFVFILLALQGWWMWSA